MARMPAPRKRIGANGRALPCVVRVPPALAELLYRERLNGRYRDETELVIAIIREWAAKQEPIDWESVLADLKREEEAARQNAEPPKKPKNPKP